MKNASRCQAWSLSSLCAAGVLAVASFASMPPSIVVSLALATLVSAAMAWRAALRVDDAVSDPRTEPASVLSDELADLPWGSPRPSNNATDDQATGTDQAEQQAELMASAADAIARARSRSWYETSGAEEFLNALAVPAIACDAQGRVVAANTAAATLAGSDTPLQRRRVDDVFTKAEFLDILSTARRGVARASRIRVPVSGGIRLVDVVATPLAPGSPAPVAVTMIDVTELAGAVQLKTDFVANASHELRTPIAAIRAAAETLEAAGQDPAMRDRLIAMIVSHTTRLDDLVRDMLDLSKLESPDAPVRVRAFDFAEIQDELSAVLLDAAEKRGITLEFEVEPEASMLRTDPRILILILKNLVENAIKHANEDTAVIIRVKPNTDETGEHAGGVSFSISDRGAGIPLAQQQRVFERFFQVDEARSGTQQRGTGLGLAIVKHGVRALDGTVDVQSVWGHGTTMTVNLPSVLEPEASDDG